MRLKGVYLKQVEEEFHGLFGDEEKLSG